MAGIRTWRIFGLGLGLSLLLLCSCATENSRGPQPLAVVVMNHDAGRGNELFVTLRLESGQELLFGVDTGSPWTLFDKSLEPLLGKRLRTGTLINFGDKKESGVYLAPALYLGKLRLQMTGPNVATFDCRRLASLSRQPIMGILGMDVLENYCIQLDFNSGQMRLLNPQYASPSDWGQPFPLHNLGDGCYYISENLVGAKGPGSLIDTGCNYDGWLTSPLYQRWTDVVSRPKTGEVRYPEASLGGETYIRMRLHQVDTQIPGQGDAHTVFNGIGLHFLARNLVTLDFPNHTLYLKLTSQGPLVP